LPSNPGVYLFKNNKKKIIYIGKAKNLKKRVASYFVKNSSKDPKVGVLVKNIYSIDHISVSSEIEAFLLEANLIKKHKPIYNFKFSDDKSYPYIKICKTEVPYISVTRRLNKDNSTYFGPYPDLISTKKVLKILRKLFPYQSVKNHPNRKCLFGHIGLCPCSSVYPATIQEYKKNIRKIETFLNGKKETVINELEKEKTGYIKTEEFELAQGIQKKIDMINYVTNPSYSPFSYEDDPQFYQKKVNLELESLKLHLCGHYPNLKKMNRIECYDISNIQGQYATGSMVVFIQGEADKSSYRRFKIQYHTKPNDYEMMKEVIRRRLKHKEWNTPDLIIVDGGKGQVNAVYEEITKSNLNIPLIGIAKKEEKIIAIKNIKKAGFIEIKLPLNNPGLNLIRRIRDEAHRFAISYHKILRRKWLSLI